MEAMARRIVNMGEMQREAGNEPKGIPCPNCGCTQRRVWATRCESDDGGYVRRAVHCLQCNARFNTKETIF